MGIYKKPRPFEHIFGGDRILRAWYRGIKNAGPRKFETHTVDLQIAKYEPRRTRWEKKTAAHARRLLLQRERWHRAKERVQDETSSTSSDSTSSNESEVDE